MPKYNIEIDSKALKEKLGIKDVDMTPILSSIASLKKDLKDIKLPKSDNKEIMSALKLLADKKTDNSDIVLAVNLLADKLSTIKSEKDYTEKFNQLMDTMATQGRLRAGYNPYNPQIRNIEGVEINPSTEEKQNTQIENQETIIGHIDGVETLLGDIKSNQTNLTQKTQMFDSWGDEIGSTMIDEMMVSEKNRICGGVFNGTTPDTNFYTTVLSGNATATISNSVLDLATTTDSGSSSLIYTNTVGRYIGGSMNHLRGIFRLGDTGKTNNTRRIGVTATSTLADSLYFQLSGTTFSIVANTTGLSQIKIDNGSFNGDSTTYPVTDTFHTWEILFTNKRIQFYVDKILIHTLTETTFPICGTRHLRPFMQNFNTGVGEVCHLYTQVLSMLTWGNTHTQSKSHYHEGQTTGILLKYGIGSIHSIVISGVVNNANVDIYNGTSTAGTKIWSSGSMTNQTVPFTIPFNTGDQFDVGLYLVKSGANCNTKLFYE